MKRSLELLIAEQICRNNEISDIKQAINHISKQNYSSHLYKKNTTSGHYIVTVIYSEKLMSIWKIDQVDETIELISKIGFDN